MFKQYSYKKKFTFLLFFFVILSLAAYKRSFSNLILLYNEHQSLKDKEELIKNQSTNINKLKGELSSLDRLIGKEGNEKEKIQQEIINFLVKNSTEVSIYDLQQIHEYDEEDYKVYSFQLDLIGKYNQLSGLAYNFEKNFVYSKIISLRYYLDKKNNKINILHLKLIFQNYENKN